jgi:hypothetical protein
MRIGVLFLVLVTGCISMTPEERAVRVTQNPDVVKTCKFLGNVRDDGAAINGPATRVEDMLKKRTAALGGNTLMLTSMTSDGTIIAGSGEAYSCPAP